MPKLNPRLRGTDAEDRLTQGGGAESDVEEEGEEPRGLIDHVDEESVAESEEEEFYEAGDGRWGGRAVDQGQEEVDEEGEGSIDEVLSGQRGGGSAQGASDELPLPS